MRHLDGRSTVNSVCAYIVAHGSAVHLRKKQVAFVQGSDGSAMFCLNQGIVKLVITSEQGKDAIIDVIGPGAIFGEDALIPDFAHRLYTATCVSDVQAAKLDCTQLSQVLKSRTDVSYDFVAYLLRRNRDLQQRLSTFLLCPSKERLLHTLVSVAKEERLGRLPKMSQQTLAEMIGTSRQYVNVLLKNLKGSQLLQQSRMVSEEELFNGSSIRPHKHKRNSG